LADGLVNQGLWIGPEVSTEAGLNLHEYVLGIKLADGSEQQIDAKHPNGHARAGLYWLVNFLSEQRIGLYKGQYVITGSYAGLLKLPMSQELVLTYGDLGKFSIQFVTR